MFVKSIFFIIITIFVCNVDNDVFAKSGLSSNEQPQNKNDISNSSISYSSNIQSNIISGEIIQTTQPDANQINEDEMADYNENNITKSINEIQNPDKTKDNDKDNQINKIKSLDIEADKIEIKGSSLMYKKSINNKSKNDVVVFADKNVVVTTDNGSKIRSDNAIINSINKTAEFKGNINADLYSSNQSSGNYINLKANEMLLFNSIDNIFINKGMITIKTVNNRSFITGDVIEKNKNKFIISNSVISGCEIDFCKKQLLPWSFKASKTVFDRDKNSLDMQNAVFTFYNVPVFYLPYFKMNINKNRKYIEDQKILVLREQTGIGLTLYPVLKEKTLGYKLTPGFELYNNFSFFQYAPIQQTTLSDATKKLMRRENNLSLKIKKHTEDNGFVLKSRFTKDYIPNNQQIVEKNQKENRYYLQFSGINQLTKNSNIEYKFSKVSDIFFIAKYDGVFDPYYKTSIAYQKYNEQKNSFFAINTQDFKNISLALSSNAQETTILPQIIFNKSFSKNDNRITKQILDRYSTLNFSSDSMNIANRDGLLTTRLNNSLQYTKKLPISGYRIVSLGVKGSNTIYNYNNFNNYKLYTTKNENIKFNNHITYFDFNMSSALPLFKKTKMLTIGIEPKIVMNYNPFNSNKSTILNQDSKIGFLNPSGMFLNSILTGYDRVEDGFRASYGVTLSSILNPNYIFNLFNKIHYQNNSNSGVFLTISQRYNNYSNNTLYYMPYLQNGLNGYSLDFLLKYGILDFQTQNITKTSSNFDSKFLSNKLSLDLKYFKFSGGQEFLSLDYFALNPITSDIRSMFYSIDFKPTKNYFVRQYVSRQSIVNSPGEYTTVTILSINHQSSCLLYSLGLQTISQTQIRSQQNQQFVFSFQLLL